MAITRHKKEEVVNKMLEVAKTANTIVFANFKKLTVNEQNELRRGLRAQDTGYLVVKKTLLKRAFGNQFHGEYPILEGEVAVIYGPDEIAPARETATFIKKFPEQLKFAGGVFGGRYVSKEEISSIAAIPGLEGLRAQFVQLINSPLQRFAVVLDQIAQKRT